MGGVLAATAILAVAAGAAQAGYAGPGGPQARAALEGLAGPRDPVDASARRPSTDAGVWAAEGPRARTLWKERRDGAVASDLGGRSLGPIRAVTVVVKGKAHDMVTNARTVAELLSAMRIEPDGDDEVAPPPGTPLSRTHRVRYTRVDYELRTVVLRTPVRPRVRRTARLPLGAVRVLEPGRPERLVRSYRVRLVDGRPASRHVVSSMVLRRGRPAVELRGTAAGPSMIGEASWYQVSSDLTAASPWLPFGTVVTVTNLATGARVTVVINDRGPFGGRLIDLSERAFERIAPLGQGVVEVRITW